MKIGLDRKVEEIQLLGSTFKIASLTINDLIALDLIDGKSMPELKEGHLNLHKMILTITYALAINYEQAPFTWKTNIFKYFIQAYRNAKIKKILSYNNLKSKLTIKNLVDVNKAITLLNSIEDDDDGKKKVEVL
jgi:hypothetical protein